MSWIFGVTGKHIPEKLILNVQSIAPPPHISLKQGNSFFTLCGGNSETIHTIDQNNSCSAILGSGLRINEGFSTIRTTDDWKNILNKPKPELHSLNGHFVIVRFTNNVLECFSDRVGLRTLYFGKYGDSWLFSTTLTWISQLIPETKINWNIFGGRWISLQQFSYESPIHNTHRLPPNGYAKIEDSTLTISSKPWITLTPNSSSPENIIQTLQSTINIPTKKIALGMSGGLDSRLLFALLASQKRDFYSYAFGNTAEPDVTIAKKIAEIKKIEFKLFSNSVPSQHECIDLLHAYVEKTNCVGPASESIRLNHYHLLKSDNTIMLDGGNGEIARRQFMYRFALNNPDDILQYKIKNIVSRFSMIRAHIFNTETLKTMKEGVENDIERSMHSLPHPNTIGLENFLDLWSAATRIPNIGSEAQPRIDEEIINFMPYTQPDFILQSLQLPLRYRNNSQLFKNLIQKQEPDLAKIPLVKNNIVYPYPLSTMQARIWTTIKAKLFMDYDDPIVHQFLSTIKEYVFDTLHSSDVQHYPFYDHPMIQSSVENYYGGKKQFAGEVNWWIAFEVWRKMVEK